MHKTLTTNVTIAKVVLWIRTEQILLGSSFHDVFGSGIDFQTF